MLQLMNIKLLDTSDFFFRSVECGDMSIHILVAL